MKIFQYVHFLHNIKIEEAVTLQVNLKIQNLLKGAN